MNNYRVDKLPRSPDLPYKLSAGTSNIVYLGDKPPPRNFRAKHKPSEALVLFTWNQKLSTFVFTKELSA